MAVLNQFSLQISMQAPKVLTLVFRISYVKLMQIVFCTEFSNCHLLN